MWSIFYSNVEYLILERISFKNQFLFLESKKLLALQHHVSIYLS